MEKEWIVAQFIPFIVLACVLDGQKIHRHFTELCALPNYAYGAIMNSPYTEKISVTGENRRI